jgi:beta-N-acetylhexosaminidase
VPVEGAHDVIGDRAYGKDPETVAALGRAAAEGLLAGGVLPVIKHIPGMDGRSPTAILALPRSMRTMRRCPRTISRLSGRWRHADGDDGACRLRRDRRRASPATTSARVIGEIIRGEIGFDGLLMSDDLSMKALSGDFAASPASLAAGCDVVLHCNGVMDEMRPSRGAAPILAGKALERADRATPCCHVGDGATSPHCGRSSGRCSRRRPDIKQEISGGERGSRKARQAGHAAGAAVERG